MDDTCHLASSRDSSQERSTIWTSAALDSLGLTRGNAARTIGEIARAVVTAYSR